MYFIIEHHTKIDYTMPLRMLEYNLIDINVYKEELLESDNFVTKAMLIEKTTDIKKLIEVVYKINKIIKTDEDKKYWKIL